jgi:hypothetical protein
MNKLKDDFENLLSTKSKIVKKDLTKFSSNANVKYLQKVFNLDIDGKIDSLLKEYRQIFYTKDCFKYMDQKKSKNRIFCLIGSDKYKDEDNFKKAIKNLTDEDRNNQDLLKHVLEKNNKRLIDVLAKPYISSNAKEINLKEKEKEAKSYLKFKYNPALYFPKIKNIDLSRIRMTGESIYSTNWYTHAKDIHHFMAEYIEVELKYLIITDATSNVGGNTIPFGLEFKGVNAVEIDSLTCDLLKNNVDVYKMKNVNIFCNDYIKIKDELKQDIVFFDPPWGGTEYMKNDIIQLYISGFNIIYLAKNVLNYNASYVFIKVPVNFDFESLNKELSSFNPTKKEIKTEKKIKYYIIGLYNPLYEERIEIVSDESKKLKVVKSPRVRTSKQKETIIQTYKPPSYKPSYETLIKETNKKIKKLSNANKPFSPAECGIFNKNPTKNPRTGKGIYLKTYKKLEKDCNISKKILYEKLVEGRGGYTVIELKNIAKDNNIDIKGLTKKIDIVNKIKKSGKISK